MNIITLAISEYQRIMEALFTDFSLPDTLPILFIYLIKINSPATHVFFTIIKRIVNILAFSLSNTGLKDAIKARIKETIRFNIISSQNIGFLKAKCELQICSFYITVEIDKQFISLHKSQ